MGRISGELLIQQAILNGQTEIIERAKTQCTERIIRTAVSTQKDTALVEVFAELSDQLAKRTSSQGKAVRAAIREVSKKTTELSLEVKNISTCAESLYKSMHSLQTLSAVSTALSAANLCATAAGFAVMNYKLDRISNNIKDIQAKVIQLVKKKNIDTISGFERLVSRYSEVLDAECRLSVVPEKEYHDLIMDVFHYIKTLYAYFMQDVIDDKNAILEAVFSLTAILSHLLVKYDSIYYFDHKSVLANGKHWHNDHEKWLGIYDILSDRPFMDKMQDYFFLESGLSQRKASEAMTAVYYALTSERVKVLDNMSILRQCESVFDYSALMDAIGEKAVEELKSKVLQLEEGKRNIALPVIETMQKELVAV